LLAFDRPHFSGGALPITKWAGLWSDACYVAAMGRGTAACKPGCSRMHFLYLSAAMWEDGHRTGSIGAVASTVCKLIAAVAKVP